MRAIGTNSTEFVTEMGIAVRRFAPLQFPSWKYLKEVDKVVMYQHLADMFDIDFNVDYKKIAVNETMARIYKEFRHELHDEYKQLLDEPMENRKAKKPKDVASQEDWDYLCELFDSEKFKKKSMVNTINHSKLAYTQCTGSRSYLSHQTQEAKSDDPLKRSDRIWM